MKTETQRPQRDTEDTEKSCSRSSVGLGKMTGIARVPTNSPFLCARCVSLWPLCFRWSRAADEVFTPGRADAAAKLERRELWVLLAALFIAVASVTTVSFFADRVQAALDAQANELLGGDLVVIRTIRRRRLRPGRAPRRSGGREHAHLPEHGFCARRREPRRHQGGVAQLPLRGRIRISDAPGAPDREVSGGPRPGRCGSASRSPRIGVKVGDALEVGHARLEIAAVITREPDSV